MWLIIAVIVAALLFGIAMRRKERGLPFVGPPRKIDVAGVLLFAGALCTNVYLIENTDRVNAGSWQWVGGMLLLTGYIGGGLVIGRWWATLFLPLLAILIAIPAGENPAYGGDIPG